MKKEQYEYIEEMYNVSQYHPLNCWTDLKAGEDVSKFYIEHQDDSDKWAIATDSIYIVRNLPSRELAEEIMQVVTNMELLFI